MGSHPSYRQFHIPSLPPLFYIALLSLPPLFYIARASPRLTHSKLPPRKKGTCAGNKDFTFTESSYIYFQEFRRREYLRRKVMENIFHHNFVGAFLLLTLLPTFFFLFFCLFSSFFNTFGHIYFLMFYIFM